MTVGQRIKHRRKELGISAEELAEVLNMDPSTIYRYEKGEIKNISISFIEKIADVLQVSPQYLAGWSDRYC